jgi:integrase/recombinase XerD
MKPIIISTRLKNLQNSKCCVHTFRHTYATHQLEAGQNIVAVKEALGHSLIQTTLMYLHIAKIDTKNRFGCLDKLYEKQA